LKAVFALRFEMDSDANSLPDFWEYRFLGQLGNNGTADSDNDGLSNLQEGQAGTDPLSLDSDQDGMPDSWEILFHQNPIVSSDAVLDLDSDGITALEEFLAGTNPESANTPMPGAAKESFGYDQADRLTRVVSPAPATLNFDSEGNLLILQ
jgi:Bacterial TSP3 repeat